MRIAKIANLILLTSFICHSLTVNAYELEGETGNIEAVQSFINQENPDLSFLMDDLTLNDKENFIKEFSINGFKIDKKAIEETPVEVIKKEDTIRFDDGFIVLEHINDNSSQLNTIDEKDDDLLKDYNTTDYSGFGVDFEIKDDFIRPSDNIFVYNIYGNKDTFIFKDGEKSASDILEDSGEFSKVLNSDLIRDKVIPYSLAIKGGQYEEGKEFFRMLVLSHGLSIDEILEDDENKELLLKKSLIIDYVLLLSIANNIYLDLFKDKLTDEELFNLKFAIPDSLMAEAKAGKERVKRIKDELIRLNVYNEEDEEYYKDFQYVYYSLEAKYNSYKTGRIYSNIMCEEDVRIKKDYVYQLEEIIERLPSKIAQSSGVYIFKNDEHMSEREDVQVQGQATKNYVFINTDIDVFDLDNVIVHEIGHIMDAKDDYTISSNIKFMNYWEKEVVGKGVLGEYAKKNQKEGWAEAFKEYFIHNLPRTKREREELGFNQQSSSVMSEESSELPAIMNELFFHKYEINKNKKYLNVEYNFNPQDEYGSITRELIDDKLIITIGGKEQTIEKTIPYDKVVKETEELNIGEERIIQEGENGKNIEKYIYRFDEEKGEVVSEKEVKIASQKVDEIIEVGVKKNFLISILEFFNKFFNKN